jgi:hypothetical protein
MGEAKRRREAQAKGIPASAASPVVVGGNSLRVIIIDPLRRTIAEQQFAYRHTSDLVKVYQQTVGGLFEPIMLSDCMLLVNENGWYLSDLNFFAYTDPKGRTGRAVDRDRNPARSPD